MAVRGRDVGGVIEQYTKFVKPAFDQFVAPSRKFADVIIPWARWVGAAEGSALFAVCAACKLVGILCMSLVHYFGTLHLALSTWRSPLFCPLSKVPKGSLQIFILKFPLLSFKTCLPLPAPLPLPILQGRQRCRH